MSQASRTPSTKAALDWIRELGSNPDAGLTSAEAAARLARQGPNEVAEERGHPLLRLAKKFWGLSAWMIELIAALSLVLHKYADMWVALALLVLNAILSFLQEQRASSAVAALRRQLRVSARVLRDRVWRTTPARELVDGDVVRLRAGDFVPADLALLDGMLRVDQSALTGESRDVEKRGDAQIHSGSIVVHGEGTAVVVGTGARTYFGRATHLVESAHPKLHIEGVISHVVRWMFIIVGVLVCLTVAVSLLQGLRLDEVLPISLVLLMSAVPVALPVMFTVSMAIGSMELAKRGALVSRLNAVEDAADMDILCADKTGTLTLNQLTFTGSLPQAGFTEEDVLQIGALASNEANEDPIDLAFLRAARARKLIGANIRTLSFVPFSPETRRTEAVVEIGPRRRRAIKGALLTLAELAGIEPAVRAELEARADEQARQGARVLAVAAAENEAPLRLIGLALLRDATRPDSKQLIDELRGLGVAMKMLTGDALPVALAIGRGLGLPTIIRASDLGAAEKERAASAGDPAPQFDGLAEVFPEEKFEVVRRLQGAGHVVGMTGDGVNDAPALRQAEVGIAVSDATDVAKGAASVVLTTEGIASIIELVKMGRAVHQRVVTWIINKLSRTILKSGYVVIAFLVTGRFVISASGMMLLVFMTDFVKVALSTDRVQPSRKPESWNIRPLVHVAIVLGVLMLLEALGLLAIGWRRFGLDENRVNTFAFQTLFFFALCSILSIRERGPFWRSRPGWILSAALSADAVAGLAIGLFGLGEMRPLPLEQTAFIVGYVLVCSFTINDFTKAYMLRRSRRATTTNDG
ncbi:MAG: plasma-membrane proton-efflux P-type ATPase [Planctomycetes bacterium]|nr:plasma-membrane proton-efflux P-type ATPase [Planctomycetota bacterium]